MPGGTIYDGNAVHPIPYPQLWQLASFRQPDSLWDVEIYRWLLPHGFAVRWQQQGGDPDPHIVWQPEETPPTAPNGTLIAWPQRVTSPEALQPALAAEGVEYVLVTPALIAAHAALFAPLMTTDGTHVTINRLPPGWRLSFAYPDLSCQWCLFQLRPPQMSTSARWAEAVELVGYDLAPVQEKALTVTLYWDVLQPINQDVVVFVHLTNEAGWIAAQIDAVPMQGYWPTSHWQTGDRLADRYRLTLPDDLSEGEYTLRVGMYDPNTLERLSVSTTQHPIIDNAVQLTGVSLP